MIVAALVAGSCGLGPVAAVASEFTGSTDSGFAEPHATSHAGLPPGEVALAPTGFISFCGRHPEDCRDPHPPGGPVMLNRLHWRALEEVNTRINLAIQADSDLAVYHRAEYWEYPARAGDCEDFVLLKKRELEARGFPRGNLLVTVVFDENNSGHAVLTVVTSEGDLILDNRRDAILSWDQTGYRFVKRQSAEDPKRWVRLNGMGDGAPATAANDANSLPVPINVPLRLKTDVNVSGSP